MQNTIQKYISASIVALVLSTAALESFAETQYTRVYNSQTGTYEYVPVGRTQDKVTSDAKRLWGNPLVKQAALGAALGAVGGAISGNSSILKGALVGGAVGTGSGLIDKSQTLNNHQYAKSAVKGAALGLGVSAISGGKLGKGALVGGAVGTGAQLLRNNILNRNTPQNTQGGSGLFNW
jgi:hypothetical protein